MKVGETPEDNTGDDDGFGSGVRISDPENRRAFPVEAIGPLADVLDLLDHDLPINGPEKACLLTFFGIAVTIKMRQEPLSQMRW